MMTIKVNHIKAEIIARKFLKSSYVAMFPLDFKYFRKLYNKTHQTQLAIKSFSWYMAKYKVDYEYMIKYAQSEDGCCHYIKEEEKAIIIYNDFTKNSGRIRWTIAHEFGHLLLGHLNDDNALISRNNLSKIQYNVYELEANTFARELLAPMSLVYYIYDCFGNNADIGSIFGLSHEAAQNILKKMFAWSRNGHDYSKDTCLYGQFHDFLHARYCDNCKAFFITDNKNKKFCHICGNKLSFGYGEYKNKMKYQDYNISKNYQLLECLQCENEDIDINNEKYAYCHICGAPVINRCLNNNDCGEIVPANARFCPYCGTKTLFYEKGILKPWKEEHEEISNPSFGSSIPPIEEIPF